MEWIRQLMYKSSDDKAATDGGRARRHIRYMHSIREQFNADDDDSDHAEEEVGTQRVTLHVVLYKPTAGAFCVKKLCDLPTLFVT